MNEMMKMIMNSSLRDLVREKPDDGKEHIMISFQGPSTEPQEDPSEDHKIEHAEEPIGAMEARDDFPALAPDTRPEDLTEKQIWHLSRFIADMSGIPNAASYQDDLGDLDVDDDLDEDEEADD